MNCAARNCEDQATHTFGPVDLCRSHFAELRRESWTRGAEHAKRILNQRRHTAGMVVYFARAKNSQTNLIKIGSTVNLTQRMRQLQAEPILVVNGSHELEMSLHRTFTDDRVDGEWYRPTERLLHFIQALEDQKLAELQEQLA